MGPPLEALQALAETHFGRENTVALKVVDRLKIVESCFDFVAIGIFGLV